jgi:hypothetical protein
VTTTLSADFIIVDDVLAMAGAALSSARAATHHSTDNRDLHRLRSRAWVNALAEQLQKRYQGERDVCVFWKDNWDLRPEFGLNELLYDVAVCRTKETEPAVSPTRVKYVSEALWAVESEMARDTRKALHDFSKLVMSSALHKLFCAPLVGKLVHEKYLSALAEAATSCSGQVFLCQIPHPSAWDDPRQQLRVFAWQDSNWIEAGSQGQI